jgi:hypothetical protein
MNHTFALLLLSGCSATRALAPLEAGQHAATLSIGGPFVQYAGAPIPAPITSVGYRYGIDGQSDVHAAFYPLGLALFNVWGVDVGVNRELMHAAGARPRLMLDMTHYFFWGDNRTKDQDSPSPAGGFRWFPDISAVFTWDLGRRPHRIYVGVDGFFQTIPKFYPMISPIVGTELRASRVVGVQLEVGWHALWQDTLYSNVVWYGPGNQGAISAKLGLNFYVPRKSSAGGEP